MLEEEKRQARKNQQTKSMEKIMPVVQQQLKIEAAALLCHSKNIDERQSQPAINGNTVPKEADAYTGKKKA